VADELDVHGVDKIIYSWLLKHPASIIPIIGSGNITRIKRAVDSFDINMSLEQWYRIFIASKNEELP
ncbi:MAG: oxidoreductase, partial [Bacteroidota bacterium]|nr:oxidoreductase [Bacteroidota bacterium]